MQKQVTFIRDRVFNSLWTKTRFDRLALASYAFAPTANSYGTIREPGDVGYYLQQHSQLPLEPLLRKALAYLVSDRLVDSTFKNTHVVLFISKIDATIVADSKLFAARVLDTGAQLTAVAMGANANAALIRQLDSRIEVIEWPIETTSEPDDWAQKFWKAYGCCKRQVAALSGKTS